MTQTKPKVAQRDRPSSSKPTPLHFAGKQTFPLFQKNDSPPLFPTLTPCSYHIGFSALPILSLKELLSSSPRPVLQLTPRQTLMQKLKTKLKTAHFFHSLQPEKQVETKLPFVKSPSLSLPQSSKELSSAGGVPQVLEHLSSKRKTHGDKMATSVVAAFSLCGRAHEVQGTIGVKGRVRSKRKTRGFVGVRVEALRCPREKFRFLERAWGAWPCLAHLEKLTKKQRFGAIKGTVSKCCPMVKTPTLHGNGFVTR